MRLYFILRPLVNLKGSWGKYGPYFESREDAQKFADDEVPNKNYKLLMVETVLFE